MVKLVQMSLKEKDTLCNPDGSDGKESHLQCRRPGFNPWVGKIPWRRAWNPLPYSCMRNPHGHRSLAGYSPWGCKAFDTTERLSVHAHTHTLFTVESRLPFSVKWQSRHSEKSCWKQNTQKWWIIDRKHLLKSIANKICNQLFKVKIIIMYCGVYK